MATPFLLGVGIAAGAYAVRMFTRMARSYKANKTFFKDSGPRPGFEPKMTRAEGRKILGVGEKASPEEIKDAFRKLLMAHHPDRGGSPYIATKINEAKEVLTNKDFRDPEAPQQDNEQRKQ
eukprot:TRINITY_DN872_c0_g1_i1.p1 TRINITY_DN872_c0_g1~~TRINITY_DN872_c0_g1_i1.p1  ORF type:complete len:121 (+),score=25.32 TRINITY_DN872_c0_g1_i1:160-522(+)